MGFNTLRASEDTPEKTKRYVINALEQPGSIFPANITVYFDGKEVSQRALEHSMVWVSFERQKAKREGKPFDAIASLTAAVPRGMAYEAKELDDWRKKGTPPASGFEVGRGHTYADQQRRISPSYHLTHPLELFSDR